MEGCAGTVAAESGAQLRVAKPPRVGDINAEDSHHLVLDDERCVVMNDGVAAEFRRARPCAEQQRTDQDRQQSEHFGSTGAAGVRLAGIRRPKAPLCSSTSVATLCWWQLPAAEGPATSRAMDGSRASSRCRWGFGIGVADYLARR